MNFAKETKPAATRAAGKTFAVIMRRAIKAGATMADLNEALRIANRVFKSRRAGLAGRKTRRQQRG